MSEVSNTPTEPNGGSVPQVWRAGCHGCGARGEGHTEDRDAAYTAVEEWKSEHRLTPGCSASPMWSSIAGIKEPARDL